MKLDQLEEESPTISQKTCNQYNAWKQIYLKWYFFEMLWKF